MASLPVRAFASVQSCQLTRISARLALHGPTRLDPQQLPHRSLDFPEPWDSGRDVKVEIAQMPVVFLAELNDAGLRLAKLDDRGVVVPQGGLTGLPRRDPSKERSVVAPLVSLGAAYISASYSCLNPSSSRSATRKGFAGLSSTSTGLRRSGSVAGCRRSSRRLG